MSSHSHTIGPCALCKRETPLTEHHLTPKQATRRKSKRHRSDLGPTLLLCMACHKQIHKLYSNRELANYYSTLEDLQGSEELMKFVKWVSKQDPNKRVRVR